MQDLNKLAELAKNISGDNQANAVSLVERMGEVIEGLGDRPIEWRPGTLKHVQGTSDRGKLPKGAGIGSFVLGESLLEQPLKVIVLRTWTSRQYWDPNPDNAKMLCNSPDGQQGFQFGECKLCPYAKFDTEANKSQCNKTASFLVVAADLSDMFMVNFSKSNYMNGVDWTGLMKKAGVAPYKRVYQLSSQTSTKNKNVELIKAEPVTGEKVEGAVLEFVEELFRVADGDRKEMLVKFYEYVKTRKTADAAALEAPADVQLIAHDEPIAVEAVEVATSEAPAESKPKKYKI